MPKVYTHLEFSLVFRKTHADGSTIFIHLTHPISFNIPPHLEDHPRTCKCLNWPMVIVVVGCLPNGGTSWLIKVIRSPRIQVLGAHPPSKKIHQTWTLLLLLLLILMVSCINTSELQQPAHNFGPCLVSVLTMKSHGFSRIFR